MQEDAFYTFTGPFKTKQVLGFLLLQTTVQSVFYSLLSLFIMVSLGAQLDFGGSFYFLVFAVNFFIVFFSLVLTDYLYVLGIADEKYKNVSRMIVAGLIFIVAVIFMIAFVQNDFVIEASLSQFATSDLFYYVPLLGWAKLALVSLLDADYMMMFFALGLIIMATLIVSIIFIHFQGDFYEEAMEDAMYYSSAMKKAKSGDRNALLENKKVKQIKSSFPLGARAIFAKEMLQMRKTNDFIRLQDVLILLFYFVITLFTGLGFPMFLYMLIIWLFAMMQNSSLVRELKQYQIYLIPIQPFKKLMALLLPTFIKVGMMSTIAIIGSGLFFGLSFKDVIQYCVMMLGYILVFASAVVLSVKILKSRTNQFMQGLMQMLVLVGCALPGVALTFYLFIHPEIFSMTLLTVITYSSLVLNIVVSLLILYGCRNMMNGRELNDD